MTVEMTKPHDGTLMATAHVQSGNEHAVLSLKSGPDSAGPRAGRTSMTGYESKDDSSDVECPTCDEGFSNKAQAGRHHNAEHGETLREYHKRQGEYECPWDDCPAAFDTEHALNVHHATAHGESIAGVEVVCEQCEGTYREIRSRVERTRFCSNDCRDKWNPGKETYACDWCGDEFEEWASQNRRFCSNECRLNDHHEDFSGESHPSWNGGGVELTCEYCGGTYTEKECRKKKGRFCSHSCLGAWRSENKSGKDSWNWKGGRFPYGAGWNEAKKEQVRERQGRLCAGCGMHESEHHRKLDVHHIQKARSFDGNESRNSSSNLVALCQSCHSEWEDMSPLRPDSLLLRKDNG